MTDHAFFIENKVEVINDEVGELEPHDSKWWQALKCVLKEGNAK